jgi:hypothetical protein
LPTTGHLVVPLFQRSAASVDQSQQQLGARLGRPSLCSEIQGVRHGRSLGDLMAWSGGRHLRSVPPRGEWYTPELVLVDVGCAKLRAVGRAQPLAAPAQAVPFFDPRRRTGVRVMEPLDRGFLPTSAWTGRALDVQVT